VGRRSGPGGFVDLEFGEEESVALQSVEAQIHEENHNRRRFGVSCCENGRSPKSQSTFQGLASSHNPCMKKKGPSIRS
jgi:hypothetical protein